MAFTDKIWHGAAWYPELWPGQVDEDLRLMREAGVDLVRVGEFAWSTMEPKEGRYELDWLQESMDKCRAAGIDVILCTPTPTPPRWLTARYPEVLRVDSDGKPYQHGSRQHVSHASPRYREFSRKITETLAGRFGRHPALVAWQTDNEFLCHVDGDFSEAAEKAWHAWLRRKYGSAENLNAKWDARIWSQDYPRIEDVPMPAKTPFDQKPGAAGGQFHCSLALDWGRFTSDTVVEFQKEQVDILRRHSSAPITHNHIAQHRLFAEDLFRDLDFASTDIYAAQPWCWTGYPTLDWMRTAKMEGGVPKAPYMIMETAPSHNGSTRFGHPSHPRGFLPVEALLYLGMGGSAFCYWLWRQQKSGVEMCHGAVVTSWGTPSVGWEDVKAVSEVIRKAGPILRGIPPAPALLGLHESKNAQATFQRAETFQEGMNPWEARKAIYQPLLELGYWRDRPFEEADVSSYKVVISAFMPILTPSLLRRMRTYVENGGVWIVGPLSGCRTEYGTVHTDAGLGELDRLAGVKTLWPVGLAPCKGDLEGDEITLEGYSFGLEPADGNTRILGRYLDGPAAGAAWCVERPVGQGRIILLGSYPKAHLRLVLELLLRDTGVPRYESSWGTTLIPRIGDGRKAFLAANWDGQGGTATLPEGGVDLLTGERVSAGVVKLGPFGMLAVEVR